MSNLTCRETRRKPPDPKLPGMNAPRFLAGGLAAAALLLAALPASAQTSATPTARVIVALKPGAAALRERPMMRALSAGEVDGIAQERAGRLASRTGLRLAAGRAITDRMQVITASGLSSTELAQRLAAQPDVAWAVPDQRRRFQRVPNDPLFAAGPANGNGPAVGQWYLRAPGGAAVSAIDAQGAWDRVSVNTSLVIAVLDSGVLGNHVDLSGRVLAGYDMISDVPTANDGNGRDADPSDPGDWITSAEDSQPGGDFQDCGASDSSWHGTQVSGIIGAIADNGLGMSGVASGVRILPVRVLGKCGGYDSDIIAGMRWAAGLGVPGVPANPNPARVLNMSLGGSGSCNSSYAETVAELTAANAVVVAAAGNSTGHPVGTPANCPGVIAVAGLRHVGSKVGFSDLGPEITISAPGGNCINLGASDPCLYPILTTSNTGTRGPVAGGSKWTDAFDATVGTSFSSPLVAGTIALMLSAQPQLTPEGIVAALRRSARPFPFTGGDNGSDPEPVTACRPPSTAVDQLQCYCTEALCGAGMLNAAAAVETVRSPGSVDDRARQLLDHAERNYPQWFPDRLATQSAPPFAFRFHPQTGAYIGVVVQPGLGYIFDGVYVLGGPFGTVPIYVGQVQSFITPPSGLAAARIALPAERR